MRKGKSMKLYDLGASIILGISVMYAIGWLADKAKPAPAPQCMVQATTADGATVQRWRPCTPDEIKATL